MNSAHLNSIALLAGVLAGLFLLLVGALVVHESGHALAALIFGFRVLHIKIGPLQIKGTDGRGLSWSRSQASINGQVNAQFRAMPGDWGRWQAVGMVAGGPCASILPALIVIPFARETSTLANLVILFTLISALFGLAQLMPVRVGGITSDGSKLISLLFGRKKREEILFALSLKVRIDQVRDLYNAGKPREALSALESFVQRAEACPGLPSTANLRTALSQLRDHIEAELAKDNPLDGQATPVPPSPVAD
jgi:hypothetical protein